MQETRWDFHARIEEACTENRVTSNILQRHNRQAIGHPQKEVDQPELLSTIINTVQASSATDDRNTAQLDNFGWFASRTDKPWFQTYLLGCYLLRLLPRWGDSCEGKRHVQSIPVKLLRPEHNRRKKNIDRMCVKSFFDDMMSISELLGGDAVTFLSNDDKAIIAFGLAAASLQSPILMHLDYCVCLPDHNIVIRQKHKLIQSVYGVCEVSITYSGDTFIWIRSGKHDTSSAYTHTYDVRELFTSKLIERNLFW